MSTKLNKRIVVLNGPPGCGKDTLANFMALRYPTTTHMKLSAPLKHMVAGFYGVDLRTIEQEKDFPATVSTFGKTYREELISVSEDWMKRRHGDDALGRLFINRLHRVPQRDVILSDGGFLNELTPIIAAIGATNMMIIKIVRPEHTFIGDSRGYVTPPNHVVSCSLHNGSNKFMFLLQGSLIVSQFFGLEFETFGMKINTN